MRMQRYNYFFKLYIFEAKKSSHFYSRVLSGWRNELCNSFLESYLRNGGNDAAVVAISLLSGIMGQKTL